MIKSSSKPDKTGLQTRIVQWFCVTKKNMEILYTLTSHWRGYHK